MTAHFPFVHTPLSGTVAWPRLAAKFPDKPQPSKFSANLVIEPPGLHSPACTAELLASGGC